MLKKRTLGEALWIDLENPTEEEVNEAILSTKIDVSAADELLNPSFRHKIEFKDSHAYLILHFPAFKDTNKEDAAYELDFVIGKNYIITVHYEKISLFDALGKTFDTPTSKRHTSPRDIIFFSLLTELLSNFDQKLVDIDHWVRDIEKKIFAGKEKQTIFELSEVLRHLIDFNKITAVYPEIFQALKEEGGKKFGKEFSDYSEIVIERFDKAQAKLKMLAETARDLRETNNSLLTTRQNETMKILTIIFITTSIIMGGILVWIELFM